MRLLDAMSTPPLPQRGTPVSQGQVDSTSLAVAVGRDNVGEIGRTKSAPGPERLAEAVIHCGSIVDESVDWLLRPSDRPGQKSLWKLRAGYARFDNARSCARCLTIEKRVGR